MRAPEHTHAVEHRHEFLAALGQQPVAELRDTQNYVHLAARGLLQWTPLTQWIDR